MSTPDHHDICVLGDSPAGLAVAVGAALLGVRVGLVADNPDGAPEEAFGNVLARTALQVVAHRAEAIRQAAGFGLAAAPAEADFAAIRRHIA